MVMMSRLVSCSVDSLEVQLSACGIPVSVPPPQETWLIETGSPQRDLCTNTS